MKIVFFAFSNISGTLSRWSTRCDWSHVDLLFDDGSLVGATKNGVELLTLNQRLMGPRPVLAYKIDEVQLADEPAAHAFALDQVGKAYDWTAVIGMFVPWRVNWDDEHRWFCSELVAAAAHAGGTNLARMDKWRISPGFLDASPMLKTINGPIYLGK